MEEVDEEQLIYEKLSQAVRPAAYADAEQMVEALKATPPEIIAQAAEFSRVQGNDAFAKGRHEEALKLYYQAIIGNPNDPRNYSNRAACWLALGEPMEALRESMTSIARDPKFSKGYYRKGCALASLDVPGEAARAFQEALRLDPGNGAIQQAMSTQLAKKREKDAIKRLEAQAIAGAEIDQAKHEGMSEAAAFRRAEEKVKQQEADDAEVNGGDVQVDLDLFRPGFGEDKIISAWRKHPKGKIEGVIGEALVKYVRDVSDVTTPLRSLRDLEDGVDTVQKTCEAIIRVTDSTEARKMLLIGAGCGVEVVTAARQGASVVCIEQRYFLCKALSAVVKANNVSDSVRIMQGSVDSVDITDGPYDVIVFVGPYYNAISRRIIPHVKSAISKFGNNATMLIPSRVRVDGVLVDAHSNSDEFDIQMYDQFRWSPGQLSAHDITGHTSLSSPFIAAEFDLRFSISPTSDIGTSVTVPLTDAGVVNAVVLTTHVLLNEWHRASGDAEIQYIGVDMHAQDEVAISVLHNTTRVWCKANGTDIGGLHHKRMVHPQLWSCLDDKALFSAYRSAVERVVKTGHRVLDVGGCGLVSMACSRAGATRVTHCDSQDHMSHVIRKMAKRNGLKGLRVGEKDIRSMTHATQEQYDVIVMECIDSGAIGEGLLHLATHAHRELLVNGGSIIPASVTIVARLLSNVTDAVCDVDVSAWNRYHWNPEYSLLHCGTEMSTPIDVFQFDLSKVGSMQPAVVPLIFRACQAGTVNAITYSFRMTLCDDIVIDTWVDRGYWRPVVQFIAPMKVEKDVPLRFLAQHDMSKITFTFAGQNSGSNEGYDVEWLAQFKQVESMGEKLNTGLSQDLHEFKRASQTMQVIASQPGWFNVDPVDAANIAAQFM